MISNQLVKAWKPSHIIICFFFYLNSVDCKTDPLDYYRLPPLHRQVDYGKCLFGTENFNIYCDLKTLIKPDNYSKTWQLIADYSKDIKRHYSHDLIQGGLCLSICRQQLEGLSQSELDDLYVAPFEWRLGRRYHYPDWMFPESDIFRKNFSKLFNQCENKWLKENYNLTGYTHIEHCYSNHGDPPTVYDATYYAFIIITLIVVVVVTLATMFDAHINNEGSMNFYKTDPKLQSKAKSSLLCFSLLRNWCRLTTKPKTELGRDLRFVLSLRYLTTMLVVFGHTFMTYAFAPMNNPQFIEQTYESYQWAMVNTGTTIVQTFFVMSGVLLFIGFHEVLKENKFNVKYFWIALVYRYIRLTPPYAYLILFHATFLYEFGDGPGWKSIALIERNFCRRNWWTNILYINNYVHPDQMCHIQSWYLAADTQIFTFALFLFMLMWKFPKHKNYFLGFSIGASCFIQFCVTYFNRYDGIYFMTPEAKRLLLVDTYKDFIKDYIATHTNAGNFLIGVVLGQVYFYFKRHNPSWSTSKPFIALWYTVPAVTASILAVVGYMFQSNDFEKPAVWIGLCSVWTRNFWGLVAIIFVIGFISKFRSPLKNFFHWPVFTPLSRLSYCIYLCHLTVSRLLFGQLEWQLELSRGRIFVDFLSVFVISNAVALILALCLEFPLTALSKELFRKEISQMQDKKIHQNNNSMELARN